MELLIIGLVLLVALAIAGVIGVVGLGSAAAIAVAETENAAEREWAGVWEGHPIVLRSTPAHQSLYIDGRLVAQQSDDTATLEGRVRDTPVIASVQRGSGQSVSLHVDGLPVPLQRRPFGTALGTGPSASAEAKDGGAVPEDPRWEAIEELVEQIRAKGGEASELALRSKVELRAMLLKIAEAEKANAAHAALGGDGDAKLRGVIELQEAQVGRLIEALRELHFGTVKEHRAPDETARVLAALEVELAQRREQN